MSCSGRRRLERCGPREALVPQLEITVIFFRIASGSRVLATDGHVDRGSSMR